MPNPTPDVDLQMQSVFLDAKNKADAEGYGGTAYCFGLQSVMDLLAARRANSGRLGKAFADLHDSGITAQDYADYLAGHQAAEMREES